jgi:molecular chaperone GrpE
MNDEPVKDEGQETTSPEPGEAVDELARLRQALDEKTREAGANYDKYLRALAELDNAKKRSQRDREEYIRYSNESLLREILPVLDNFDRALQASRDAPASGLLAGIELIHRELLRVLEKFGVTPFTAVGQPFDPEKHEAVMRVETTEVPEMTVIEEMLKGYVLNGRVLRHAAVSVAVRPEEGSS